MIDMVDRRRFPRYPIYCPIEYRCEDDAPADSSITLNLCEGGALISTNRRLGPGARLIIKIALKGEVFFVRARVAHVELEETTGIYNIGVEFVQNPFNFVRRFYDELEAIMLYQRQFAKETGRPISLAEASLNWYNLPR
jgi:c-di-GMP-binding flagellar brake protein YcgR